MMQDKTENNLSSSCLTQRSGNKDLRANRMPDRVRDSCKRDSAMISVQGESGRTMTEMLAVLGIIGVLSVGGMAFGSRVIGGIKANRVVSGVQERILLA